MEFSEWIFLDVSFGCRIPSQSHDSLFGGDAIGNILVPNAVPFCRSVAKLYLEPHTHESEFAVEYLLV